MVNGQWSMVNGQCNGQWSMVNGQWSIAIDVQIIFLNRSNDFSRLQARTTEVVTTSAFFFALIRDTQYAIPNTQYAILMLICLNPISEQYSFCGGQNIRGAQFCKHCGKPLRLGFALQLDEVGTQIAHYRIVGLIGHGEGGAVYEAVEVGGQERRVALKQVFAMNKMLERQEEVVQLQQLAHPHLPRYLEMFTQQGKGYLVMELVGADSLADMRAKEALPIERVLAYGLQLCEVLIELHQQSPPILHRDIKPANIRLLPEGELKLMDLGLNGGGLSNGVLRYPYASLEQLSGEADVRSDIYSWGATLYYLLTGSEPVPALERLAASPDPLQSPSLLNSQLSPYLADVIMGAMSLLRQNRYRDATMLKGALEDAIRWSKSPPAAISTPQTPALIMPTMPTAPRALSSPFSDSSDSSNTLIVSQTGIFYKSINEAIFDAPPGGRILIRPGTYSESLVIDKPVILIGDGPVEQIIIESWHGSCIQMQTDYAELHGLSLHVWAKPEAKCFAVDIPMGELLLEGCDIRCHSLACIAIHGASAKPTIRHCTIHEGKRGGIVMWENAQALIEACEIFANAYAGIAITDGATPLIRHCRIHDGESGGIFVFNKGRGIIEGCEIWGNAGANISIRTEGAPLIRECKIYNGGAAGVYVWDNGQGTIEACEIFGHTVSGLDIKLRGNPVVKQTKIYKNANGVLVWHRGAGLLEECEIFANRLMGVEIRERGSPIIRSCQIHKNSQSGILVRNQAKGLIKDCDIFSNTTDGIEIRQDARPMIRNCRINRNQWGIEVTKDGLGNVEFCDLRGNQQGAWKLEQGWFKRSKVRRLGNKVERLFDFRKT